MPRRLRFSQVVPGIDCRIVFAVAIIRPEPFAGDAGQDWRSPKPCKIDAQLRCLQHPLSSPAAKPCLTSGRSFILCTAPDRDWPTAVTTNPLALNTAELLHCITSVRVVEPDLLAQRQPSAVPAAIHCAGFADRLPRITGSSGIVIESLDNVSTRLR